MIRQLEANDREQVLEFLAPESAENLFLIGDIENNGLETSFQEVWGDFAPDGSFRAVLLRYYGSFIPYAPGEFDLEGLAGIIRLRRHQMEFFSGIERVIDRFTGLPDLLPEGARRRELYFVELRDIARLETGPEAICGTTDSGAGRRPRPEPGPRTAGEDLAVERGTAAAVSDVYDLWDHIEEFEFSSSARESSRRELEQGASRLYLIRDDRRVVATAKTTAENSRSAMIIGVATHPGYRRQGLATRLLTVLCRELLSEGKRPCLFYDNPEAGSIYRRVGFTDIGTWVMYQAKRPEP